MQAATDTKQPVVTHGFLGTDRSSHPVRPPAVPLPFPANCSGKEVKLTGRCAHQYRAPGSFAPSRSVFVNNRCQGGRRRSRGGRETERGRERRGGGGSQSPRPPRGGAAWICSPACVRARARPNSSPARRSEGAQKKTEKEEDEEGEGGGRGGGGSGRRGRWKLKWKEREMEVEGEGGGGGEGGDGRRRRWKERRRRRWKERD